MNVVAYTKLDQSYPGFINFTPNDDGGVTIHLRGDPQLVAGEIGRASCRERVSSPV